MDFAALHLDLAGLWRARRHRYMLAIIERLPRDSCYIAELADDDDLAAQAPPGDEEPPRLTLRDFGAGNELLAKIYDRLGELGAAQAAAAGAKGRPPRRHPRPELAADRLRRQRNLAVARRLAAIFFPEDDTG